MEISIVIPALNEERTIPIVINKAKQWLTNNKIEGEILIVDNGSTDKTAEVSQEIGARVVKETQKGYGNALKKGFKKAKGKYIIMGDADDSYDFLELDEFIKELRNGEEVVIGNRYAYKIPKGAMPASHKYLGTPVLTKIINLKYGCKLKDINCGLRGMSKERINSLNLESSGMEFASEMIIKACKNNFKIKEVPIHFYCDKRDRKPHLNTIKDGIRHLKLIFNIKKAD